MAPIDQPARYLMRQRMFSIGEDFAIEDERGERAFYVDGQVLRLRETFVIKDAAGHEVATVRQKLVALRESMTIERDGATIATVRRAWIAPLRDKFVIDVPGGQELIAQGSIWEHEYAIRRGHALVAEISKHWFSFTDSYGITVEPGEDDALILAIAVAIDEMAHDPDEAHQGE
jgi:uncharacterized protein YxjI